MAKVCQKAIPPTIEYCLQPLFWARYDMYIFEVRLILHSNSVPQPKNITISKRIQCLRLLPPVPFGQDEVLLNLIILTGRVIFRVITISVLQYFSPESLPRPPTGFICSKELPATFSYPDENFNLFCKNCHLICYVGVWMGFILSWLEPEVKRSKIWALRRWRQLSSFISTFLSPPSPPKNILPLRFETIQ